MPTAGWMTQRTTRCSSAMDSSLATSLLAPSIQGAPAQAPRQPAATIFRQSYTRLGRRGARRRASWSSPKAAVARDYSRGWGGWTPNGWGRVLGGARRRSAAHPDGGRGPARRCLGSGQRRARCRRYHRKEGRAMASRLRTIVIGTALTEASDQLVRNGLRVARAAGARLRLVHAFQSPLAYAGEDPSVYGPELIEGKREGRRARLH